MSLGYGIGKGLETFGDSLMKMFIHRDDLKQKAMDRALREKAEERQGRQQEALAGYYEAQGQNLQDDNARQHAEFTAKYYGGAEDVPQGAIDSIDPKYRDIMVKSTPRSVGTTISTEEAPLPEGLIPGSSFEVPQMQRSFRQPETAQERIAKVNAEARQATEQARQSYLMKKLASDEQFKQMAHELGEARLQAEINRVAQQIQATYAGQDLRTWQTLFDAQMDAELARFRAESRGDANDPMKQIMADILRQSAGITGQPEGTPAQPPVRPVQIPNMPPPGRTPQPRANPRPSPFDDPSDPLGIKKKPQ